MRAAGDVHGRHQFHGDGTTWWPIFHDFNQAEQMTGYADHLSVNTDSLDKDEHAALIEKVLRRAL